MYTFNKDDTAHKEAKTADRDILVQIVRVLGVCLFLVGLWAAVHTLYEAFRLYRDPGRVAQFASYIEQGLGETGSVAPAGADTGETEATSAAATPPHTVLNRSGRELIYFIAWVVTLLLLFLIATIAFSCIRTGAGIVMQSRTGKDKPRES